MASLKPIGWTVAVAAMALPVVARLTRPGELAPGVVRVSAVIAVIALGLALHRKGKGVLRVFWPAVVGGVTAAYLPVLGLGRMLLPPSGVYRSTAARPGLEVLAIDRESGRMRFGSGNRKSFGFDESWDGTLGGDAPPDGADVICLHCPPWFTVSRRWPWSDRLVLVELRQARESAATVVGFYDPVPEPKPGTPDRE